MRKLDRNTIHEAFASHDRMLWEEPRLEDLDWDDHDFLAWPHPQAGSYFFCVPTEQAAVGAIFEMNAGAGSFQGSCDICHAQNHDVGIKSALIETHSNPRRKIGFHVCADLGCSARIRGLRPALFPYETISVGRRIERLQEKLARIVSRLRS
jgi:hypothetical protein